MEQTFDFAFNIIIAFRIERLHQFVPDFIDGVLSFVLARDFECSFKLGSGLLGNFSGQLFVDFSFSHFDFFLAQFFTKLVLQGNELFDALMSKFERSNHVVFIQLLRSRFHHDDGVCRTRHDQIEVTVCQFFDGRVEHQVAVNTPDAGSGDWIGKGDV